MITKGGVFLYCSPIEVYLNLKKQFVAIVMSLQKSDATKRRYMVFPLHPRCILEASRNKQTKNPVVLGWQNMTRTLWNKTEICACVCMSGWIVDNGGRVCFLLTLWLVIFVIFVCNFYVANFKFQLI